MNGLEHLVQRHAGMLEYGANLDGELFAALATLFEAVANDAFRVLGRGLGTDASQIIDPTTDRATVRASNPINPYDAFKKSKGLGFVMEMG